MDSMENTTVLEEIENKNDSTGHDLISKKIEIENKMKNGAGWLNGDFIQNITV